MDNSILTALIAAGSAFAGVVGGGVSNYLVNINIEKRKLRYQRREELFDQLSILRVQIRQAYQHYCEDKKINLKDKVWLENEKIIQPNLKVDHLIRLYFQSLKHINEHLKNTLSEFIELATNDDETVDQEWKKSQLENYYNTLRENVTDLQERLSRMK